MEPEETNPLKRPLEPIPENVVLSDGATWRFIEDKVGPYWHDKELYSKLLDKYVQKANEERQLAIAKYAKKYKIYQTENYKKRDPKNLDWNAEKRYCDPPMMPPQEYIPLRMIDTETLRIYSWEKRRPDNPFRHAFPDYIRKPRPPQPAKPSLFQTILNIFTPLGHT